MVLTIVTIVLLFFAAQATRFESDVQITYADGNFTALIGGNVLTLPVEENFTQVTANLQKSMLAENGVGRFSIISEGKVLAEYDSITIHLFGKDVTGKLLKGNHPNFRNTFGDWTMDRFMSENVVLYNTSLPSHFSMEITFVGRGYKKLLFHGQQNMYVDINDGYLDNNYSICYAGKCVTANYEEFVFTNVKRIANFFIDAFLLTLTIMLIIKIITKRADLR